MSQIVNLKRARKAKQRAEKEKRASGNRARFGRSKDERERAKKLAELEANRAQAHKIEHEE